MTATDFGSLDSALLADLRAVFAERITVDPAELARHGADISHFPAAPPDAVVFPRSTDEVRAIVALCRDHQTPIIPYGVGSSVEGHVLAPRGGVCVDLSRLNAIVAIRPDDLDCTVQAGVTRKQLNAALEPHDLFFSVDPGADATIGGMVSTRASGTNSVRYGTIRENTIALTVVTADGRVVKTGSRARKSAAGYDLTHLLVGSEGTLGVIVEATLRLHPLPRAISAAVCSFPEVTGAVETIIETMRAGVSIARAEALCGLTMRAINAYSGTAYPERPTAFLEFHGTETGVREQAETVQAIARRHGGEDFVWAAGIAERDRLWAARHQAYYAATQLRPGCRTINTDVCVPLSRLAECMTATAADIARASMPIPLFGHVGDGNFHCVIPIRPDDPADLAEATAFNDRLVDRALAMEGTCTGEHGIGLGKIASLQKERGEAVALMRAIKRALDPDNLMNPGKVLALD